MNDERDAGSKLNELIRECVLEILEEESNRASWIRDLTECLSGAIGEYFKARIAEINGVGPDLQIHWDSEVNEHFMFRFAKIVRNRRRAGKNHRLAFAQVLEDLRQEVPPIIAWAERTVCADLGLSKHDLVEMTDATTDEFFARAENEYDALITP